MSDSKTSQWQPKDNKEQRKQTVSEIKKDSMGTDTLHQNHTGSVHEDFLCDDGSKLLGRKLSKFMDMKETVE